jgi:hypothetical protein
VSRSLSMGWEAVVLMEELMAEARAELRVEGVTEV